MRQLVAVCSPAQNSQGQDGDTALNAYLEGELLVENGIEGLPVDLGFELLLLVRQQVDLHVGVRRAAHVHGRQLCSLDDPHDELVEEDEAQSRESQTSSWKKHISVKVGQSFKSRLAPK